MIPAPYQDGLARVTRRASDRFRLIGAHLELTYDCNWSCAFCCNPRRDAPNDLGTTEWVGIIDSLREAGALVVTLTGGDPLVRSDFLTIARAVRERHMALRVLTNGSLVTDGIADALGELRPTAVELSLLGATAATHDRASGCAGSFVAMMDGVERLRGGGVRLVLKCLVTRFNEDEIDGMIALGEDLGVPSQLDAAIVPRDDGDRGPLRYRASERGIEHMYRRVAQKGYLPAPRREPHDAVCLLGRTNAGIDPAGSVYPCPRWRLGSLGNATESPVSLLWGRPRLEPSAAVACQANDRLLALGDPLASFPYCPALAASETGDPLMPSPFHTHLAAIASRVRQETA